MSKAKYIFSRLKKMDISSMLRLAAKVSERSGKNKAAVLLDMCLCGLIYQAGYTDYELFAMERASSAQRKTYVTRGINDKLVKRFNDAGSLHFFINKDEFNETFADFIHRDWMRVGGVSGGETDEREQVEKLARFCRGKDEIVAKPRDAMCGKGIEIISPADFDGAASLYKHLLRISAYIVEEKIVQHPVMDTLYPGSVNTLRVVTINNGGDVSVVVSLCRVGNGGRVDNFLNGGMVTRVCSETGKLLYDAVDSKNNVYEKHPITGTVFKGFQVPMWDECKKMAREAAAVLLRVGYVGWDIAVTPSGPALVEGNEFPGHCLYQLPPHTPDNYGILPLFEKAAGGRIKRSR
ncbi:MAG: hypothetical protein GX107_00815 [Clostridiales bacterium]|jgi:preprotein translocase subunit Sss1|nr:hypothetical protein [Clostridiales bacterium]